MRRNLVEALRAGDQRALHGVEIFAKISTSTLTPSVRASPSRRASSADSDRGHLWWSS